MGLLGPSKSELGERIDDLEQQLETANQDRRDLRDTVKEATETAQQTSRALRGITDNIETVEDKHGVVETLEEPRIGWKATNDYIAKLYLPKGTTVVHPLRSFSDNKKRCDEAVVVQLYEKSKFATDYTVPTNKLMDHSNHDHNFTYIVGNTVTPDMPLNTDIKRECTSGIHFFCSKEAAVDWL